MGKAMNAEVNFQLLANVQLARRLSKLIAIDDNIAIDPSYITVGLIHSLV
jgi:hypothetical protein